MARKFESDQRWDGNNEDFRPAWSIPFPYDWINPITTAEGRLVVTVPNCTQTMADNILSVPGAVIEVTE